jgi:aspartate carbamoyltransferase catalytic subunit
MSTAAATTAWTLPHLLGLQDLSAQEMRAVLSRARQYAVGGAGADTASSGEAASVLRGHVVANLFFEDSTRTRMSFSLAARRLGADVLDLSSTDSSVNKGETIRDTAANVAAMGVGTIVVRHKASGAAALVARAVGETWGTRVVNAGDGKHEHPTQGLLDVYTISESFGRLETFDLSGLKVAIVGDVASSRVARSDIAALTALGASVVCVGPPTLVPPSLRVLGCEVCHDLDEVIDKVHAVNVLRIQFERAGGAGGAGGSGGPHGGTPQPATHPPAAGGWQAAAAKAGNVVASVREYAELYGLSLRRAQRMKRDAIILHPGPINRGVEMTAAVADGEKSVVLRQVGHGVAVRMAVLELCASASAR